jgi:hypothetical protein
MVRLLYSFFSLSSSFVAMKYMCSFFVVAYLLLARASANDGGSTQLTFTYQTLSDGTVRTTTTTYAASASRPPKAHSSYRVNSKHLAYPTFSNITGSLANNAPASGLPNATFLAEAALLLISQRKVASPANCQTCQTILAGVAARMKVQQETLSAIAGPFCQPLSAFLPEPICIGLLKVASTDIGGAFPAMDMLGEDGQAFCAFMFGSCDLPAPPQLDFNCLFKGTKKPTPRKLEPSKSTPLKVLHISDYHLDMRYVVGSEANCTGPLCCRVYPYTNLSAPIQEPASLFGNYLCDTPEPLATSVFRSVPKVTGSDWKDFAFGIFTGDLVSHDLWELTKPYVEAENLESFQQFFNGMGGVKMYPTLG